MKRDLKLINRILVFVEEQGSPRHKGSVPIDGYERDAINYHLQLLAGAGYIQLGQETLSNMGALLLTWKGCDYLDELRQNKTV